MSRIGKLAIKIPDQVTVEVSGHTVTVKGPKGELKQTFLPEVNISTESGEIVVTRKTDNDKAVHGLTRALIANMVEGVTTGFFKELEMAGIGYRANVEGRDLVMAIGYSHPVKIEAPEGIQFSVTEGKIKVEGIDKALVGQIAANIRSVRPPEPYKGKGIHYLGEYIRRKAGKTAKAAGATGGTGGK
ncbi:MAG TPA: 50S ribosomal protein L6 [Patescibacteria group bacterium]|nr:50S ribosomal protein L6 [Patescibacteria group bacterium]